MKAIFFTADSISVFPARTRAVRDSMHPKVAPKTRNSFDGGRRKTGSRASCYLEGKAHALLSLKSSRVDLRSPDSVASASPTASSAACLQVGAVRKPTKDDVMRRPCSVVFCNLELSADVVHLGGGAFYFAAPARSLRSARSL